MRMNPAHRSIALGLALLLPACASGPSDADRGGRGGEGGWDQFAEDAPPPPQTLKGALSVPPPPGPPPPPRG